MKQFVRFVAACAIAVGAIGGCLVWSTPSIGAQNSGASPSAFEPGDRVIVTSGPVNLRVAPGRNTAILETLEVGVIATVLDGPQTANGLIWYQINPDTVGQDGWVVASALAIASAGAEFSVTDEVVVINGYVNLRSDPGIDSGVLTQLPQGTTGTIVDVALDIDGYNWYALDLNSDDLADGWVAGDFLARVEDTTPSNPGAFPQGSYVFVNAPKLNLRAEAGTSAAAVRTLRDGDMATVVTGPTSADGYDWYPLDLDGDGVTDGWAAGQFLSGGLTVGDYAIVADGSLYIRSSTNKNASVSGTLQTGDEVYVADGPFLSGGITWFSIESESGNGYVAGRYLGPDA